MRKLLFKPSRAVWRWMQCLVRSLSGETFREMKQLEKNMKHWHKEESDSLLRAKEANICGNYERAAKWIDRSKEARMRCNKDFREPLKKLTGNPDLFKANVKLTQRPTNQD